MTTAPSQIEDLSHLFKLDLGRNAIREFPPVQSLSGLEELLLNDNELTEVPEEYFDTLHTLQVLSLANNNIKGPVDVALGNPWSELRLLNLSQNDDLTSAGEARWPGIPDLEVLDISFTNITVTPHMCTRGVSIFASKTPQPQTADLLSKVIESCFTYSRLLDISAANATLMEAGLYSRYEVLGSKGDSGKSNSLSFRFQTSNYPVQCNLRQGFRLLSGSGSQKNTVLEYQCRCAPGYVQSKRGRCTLFWGPGLIARLVLGSGVLAIISTLAFVLYCRRLRRRRQAMAFDLDLHKGLLEETTNDVMALKRAWEIEWVDLILAARIDQGAEGAFGDVIILGIPYARTE